VTRADVPPGAARGTGGRCARQADDSVNSSTHATLLEALAGARMAEELAEAIRSERAQAIVMADLAVETVTTAL
jgi:hypothetical protein